MEFFMEKDGSQKFDGDGLVIPFVSPPSERAEKIGIQLRQIVSDMTGQIESNEFCSSVAFVAVLKELADMYKSEKNTTRKMTEKNVLKIKEYIDGNIEKSITLSDIAHYVGRSPNHTGTVFKKNTGMTVTTYINMGKVKEISRLMKTDRMNFREACEAVSISDESYGYRLFKKYVGLTPRVFAETTHIEL